MADSFTVDPGSLVVSGYTHVLHGTKTPGIVAMSLNGDTSRITFPTSTTWQAQVVLAAGTNIFALRGQDKATNWTPAETIQVVVPSFEQSTQPFFDTMDEHGLRAGLERNPGEKNWDYRTRLLSFSDARTGSHDAGLFYAIAHELGIKPVADALQVRVRRGTTGVLVDPLVFFGIGPVYAYMSANGLVARREPHLVDPRHRKIELAYEPRWAEQISVVTAHGETVSEARYELDLFKLEVTFKDDDLAGKWVVVEYPYYHRVAYRSLTLGQLKTQLESVSIGGEQLLEVAVSDPNLGAIGLLMTRFNRLTKDYLSIPRARVWAIGLDDKRWQESLLNSFGAAYGTQLELWARKSRQRSNIGWDNLTLDEGLWDIDADQRALDFLPRLHDPVFGRWHCTLPDHAATYRLLDYRKYGGYCPVHADYPLEYRGVKKEDIQSGTGSSGDLLLRTAEVTEEL